MRALACIAVLSALCAAPALAQDDILKNTIILDGVCLDVSHTSEGPASSDLGERRSRFYCDSAVISEVRPGRLLFQFAEKGSHRENAILAFAANDGDDPEIVEADAIYFEPGKPTPAEGVCKLFFDAGKLTGLTCGGRVEQGDRASVAVVAFEAR